MIKMATNTEGETLSFKDKRKFFEQEIQQQSSKSPKNPQRKFSYLNEHEVAKIKQEEEKKMSVTSKDELMKNMQDHTGDKDYDHMIKSLTKTSINDNSMPSPKPIAEKRLRIKRHSHDMASSLEGELPVYPSDIQYMGRSGEWRKQRMQSLNEDALRAQTMMANLRQLGDMDLHEGTKDDYRTNGTTNGSVETTNRQIVRLELGGPRRGSHPNGGL